MCKFSSEQKVVIGHKGKGQVPVFSMTLWLSKKLFGFLEFLRFMRIYIYIFVGGHKDRRKVHQTLR